MSLLLDALEWFRTRYVETNAVRLMDDHSTDKQLAFLDPRTGPVFVPRPIDAIEHELLSLQSLVDAEAAADGPSPTYWVSPTKVTVVLNSAGDRCDRLGMRLEGSSMFAKLAESPVFDPKALVHWLRTECVMAEISPEDFRSQIANIKFKRESSDARQIEHGMESASRENLAAVMNAVDIPEVVEFTDQVFPGVTEIGTAFKFRCAVILDPENGKIRLKAFQCDRERYLVHGIERVAEWLTDNLEDEQGVFLGMPN